MKVQVYYLSCPRGDFKFSLHAQQPIQNETMPVEMLFIQQIRVDIDSPGYHPFFQQ